MAGISLDDLDWALLAELQSDGRASITQLARTIKLSVSATGERLRRLEESGAVTGYSAIVDVEKLGYTILAQLRLRYPSSRYQPLHDLIAKTPEIIEAHHVTGEDCFVLKVIATSMRHLEEVSGRIGGLGSVTTSVAYSSPLERRAVQRPAVPVRPTASRTGKRQG
jgi:Lrp/AsnC family leucine-responsive transcriptional regulator